jgi:hypothetical protein
MSQVSIDERAASRQRLAKKRKRLPDELSYELIYDTIDRNKGNIRKSAEELDVNYVALMFYAEKKKDLLIMTVKHREALVDLAEENLETDLKNGNQKATLFTLKTLGKDRGYVERTEMNNHTVIEEVKSEVDLDKLSVEQLKELQDLLDGTLIDVSPETN